MRKINENDYSFNSIKVQLEHSLFVPANALEVSFNSIKVQLELAFSYLRDFGNTFVSIP